MKLNLGISGKGKAKKGFATLLIMVCMCIIMAACGKSQKSDSSTGAAAENKEDISIAAEATTAIDTTKVTEDETLEPADTKETDETLEPEDTKETDTTLEPEDMKATAAAENDTIKVTETGSQVLVIYFSETGHTKAVAEKIASGLSADIYEITAAEPYTAQDLDYNDDRSRSTAEMNDPSARPAISGDVNTDRYDTIYIGYPIWWGEAPRIMYTFAENHDLTGKTVIPFCTSASSGVGSSAKNLEGIAGTGNWLEGHRFSGSESTDTVMEWVNGS